MRVSHLSCVILASQQAVASNPLGSSSAIQAQDDVRLAMKRSAAINATCPDPYKFISGTMKEYAGCAVWLCRRPADESKNEVTSRKYIAIQGDEYLEQRYARGWARVKWGSDVRTDWITGTGYARSKDFTGEGLGIDELVEYQ
ncbi:hypothetical protein ACCO45_009902 [Purpureocillium lilacinum]|uniref:Uncharacterized protein n=1 Tax=Purpureocillium lilacinum TaxID=33203 RepID=A0ACC4DKM2_PURLI